MGNILIFGKQTIERINHNFPNYLKWSITEGAYIVAEGPFAGIRVHEDKPVMLDDDGERARAYQAKHKGERDE